VGKPYLNRGLRGLNEILNSNVSSIDIIESLLEIINIWINKRDNTSDYIHPTQKPIKLYERPIRRCSRINDNILDLFGGSGSTLIACEQLNRRCFMMEIDPIYCDVIINRWEQFTGKKSGVD